MPVGSRQGSAEIAASTAGKVVRPVSFDTTEDAEPRATVVDTLIDSTPRVISAAIQEEEETFEESRRRRL